MELAGLVIGVAGLFGVCMDILDRVSSYREFSTQSRQTIVSFEANKVRLKDWAAYVGIEDGALKQDHHVRLDEPEVRSAVKSVLEEISALFDSIEHSQSRLRLPQVIVSPAKSSMPTSQNSGGVVSKASSKSSIRGGISWALKGKESFISQVEIFGEFVDMLHKLVPKEQDGSDALVKDFKTFLTETRQNSRLQTQKGADEWLDATGTDQQYERHLSARLDGTCNWISSDPAYKTWESDDFPQGTAKLLWICGPAGSGKSVLCARIIQQFTEKPDHPVAHFFSTGHVQTGGRPDGVVRSWISQAARIKGEILELVQQAMDRTEATRRASQAEIWRLFRAIASDFANFTFVLDGLDEYEIHDDERAQLLRNLKEQAKGTKCRVLVVSRDEVDLNQELCATSENKGIVTMLECKISKSKTQPEIQLYSESIVNKKLAKKDASLRQELANQMAEKCDGMFLWIKMQQDQLRSGKNEKQLRNIVTTMPSGLYQIYERNWLSIQKRPADERRRAISILRWATFAYEPLRLSELTEAVAIYDDEEMGEAGGKDYGDEDLNEDETPEFPVDELPDDIDEDYVSGEIKDLCGSLIEVRNDMVSGPLTPQGYAKIYLAHASVKEYLHLVFADTMHFQNIGKLSLSQPSQAIQHSILAKTCLRYLTYPEVWDGTLPDFEVYHGSFLGYAATSWYTHARAAGKNDRLIRQINNFFHKNPNFSQWKDYIRDAQAGPLYYACRLGLLDTATFFLKEIGEDPNEIAGKFGTALQAASYVESLPLVELLVDSGADINLEGGEYGSAVNAAVASGCDRIIYYLIDKGAKLDSKSRGGRTAIHLSAKNGNTKLLERLVCNDADVTMPDNEGVTALHLAASSGCIETVRLLLRKGADVGAVTSAGQTPLCYACKTGHTDIVQLLVGEGTDIQIPSSKDTPVYEAACSGHIETLRYLISQGAVVTSEGRALHITARKGYTDVLKLLVSAGISLEDGVGDKALSVACSYGYIEIVRFLLGKGVRAENNRDSRDTTPLYSAVRRGHTRVVKILLGKGANPNTKCSEGNFGETPLTVAAREGFTEIVGALLKKGADVKPESNCGLNPLLIAAQKGHVEIVRRLLCAGADPLRCRGWLNSPMLQSVIRGNDMIFRLMVSKAPRSANFHVPIKYGTLLNAAAYGGNLGTVSNIIENGGPTWRVESKGRNAAHYAARGGHAHILQYLLDKGFDPQATDITGRGIVHYAACGGSVEALRVALAAQPPGAKISESTWSPLHWACKSGSIEAVNFLLEHGVKESTVTTTIEPAADWTPFRIAVFHQNIDLIRRWNQTKPKLDESIVVKGDHQPSIAGCCWCLHELYGPYYQRSKSRAVMLCFMCRVSADKSFPDDEWKTDGSSFFWTTDINEGPKWYPPDIGNLF